MYQQVKKQQNPKMSQPFSQNSQSISADLTQNQESSVILTYYYIRGLCQPIRNLLYYLNIPFEDRRLDRNSIDTLQLDKLQSTFNSGLPSFQDQYVNMSDSVAIAIYICKKYGVTKLIGSNIKEKAKINQVMFKYWMEKKKITPQITQIIKKTTGYYQAEKGAMIRQMLNKLANQTRFINFCLKNHQKTQGWILQQLTLIDFYFYETCFYINGFFNSYIEADQRLGLFVTFAQKFEQLAFHNKRNTQKTKLFFPFKNENLRQIVTIAWQGEQQQQIM